MNIRTIASGSAGNCYIVEHGGSRLLLECGVSKKELRGLDIATMDGCLLSHEHGDHSKSICEVMAMGVDVYATQATFDALQVYGHRAKPIISSHIFDIGQNFSVFPFPAEHDAADPVGFLICTDDEKMVYATDTAYMMYRFKGVRHIVIECNYDEQTLSQNIATGAVHSSMRSRLRQSHMRLETLLEWLKKMNLSGCHEITLIHMSDTNCDADLAVSAVQELTGIPVNVV